MGDPIDPSADPSRTSPYTPIESVDTEKKRTTDQAPPSQHDTANRGTNNQNFSVDNPSTVDQQMRETGSYYDDPGQTKGYKLSSAAPQYRAVPGYEILGKLGQGGMGVVYKARDLKLNRLVAIKMILGGTDAGEAVLQRFQTEAEAVAKLQHPNIVQIFGVGETDGCPYFALEFVPGTNLAEKVGREPQEPKYAATMVETLARAMQGAHQAKIIHRDLKPANVLLTTDGVPKIADFGLAKELESNSGQTNTGAIVGTPSYMSPEQASGTETIGPAADIYALGAILYDLLTGRPPFAGTTKWNTIEMVRKMEPIPPGVVTGNIPKDLDTICMKCLQKEPAKRYATAVELADDLRRFLEGRPILARPVSNVEKAWRWAKRNPVVAGLSTTFLATVIGFGIVSWILKTQADENARKAQAAKIEEAKQKVLAQTNAEVATESNNQSIEIIRKMITEFQDALRTNPAARPNLEKITRSAMSDVEKLKIRALNSPIISRTEAGSLGRLGDLFLEQNRPVDADELFLKAESVLRQLKENDPADPVHVRNLAAILNKRGDAALRLGDTRKAHERYTDAFKLRETWLAMPSKQIVGRPAEEAAESVAQSHMLLAQSLVRLGQPAEAMKHWKAAITGFKALPVERFKSTNVQRDVTLSELDAAQTTFRLGRMTEAKADLAQVVSERLAKLKAESGWVNRILAATAIRYEGDFAIQSGGNPVEAWRGYHRTVPVFVDFLKLDPQSYSARRDLALIHFKMGITAEKLVPVAAVTGLGLTHTMAEHHFSVALKLREELAKDGQLDTRSLADFAISLSQTGRIVEAEPLVESFQKQSPSDPWVGWLCANILAMARGTPADAKRCHDRAIGILERIVVDGWRDFVAIRTEPTLDSLRNDPRFLKVISQQPVISTK